MPLKERDAPAVSHPGKWVGNQVALGGREGGLGMREGEKAEPCPLLDVDTEGQKRSSGVGDQPLTLQSQAGAQEPPLGPSGVLPAGHKYTRL